MKKIITLLLLVSAISAQSQNAVLKAGDHFPDVTFHTLVNAPMPTLDLNSYPTKKLFIINFWGTWCSPCIPEMNALAKLQDKYQQQVQIIGYADDPKEKLVKYNTKKPSKIWLVSDTSYVLYKMLSLASVGHCILLDAQRNIIAVVKTDSVNEAMINRFLKGEKIKSNGEIAEVSHSDKDAFGVDSLLNNNFTIRAYMKDQQGMYRTYARGPFSGRRVTAFNSSATALYKLAFGINSSKQISYGFDQKKYDSYSNKEQLYCFDLLVAPAQKDSLMLIMQRKLNESLPIKCRLETKTIPVYVLKRKENAAINIPETKGGQTDIMFSGNGYDSKNVTIDNFADYLNNELDLPITNETGLTGHYNIKTENDVRDKANILAAVDKLGLVLEKTERPMKVLVLYR